MRREVWESALESMWRDIRYGARMLRQSPGFAAVAVGILALGIGANTAIFSLVNTVMLRMLPVRDPSTLVQLLSRYPGEPRNGGFPLRFYEHVRDRNHVFSDLIAVSPSSLQVSGEGADAETIDGHYVTGNFFTALGVPAAMGRPIDPKDDRADAGDTAVVVSWSYWQKRFAGEAGVVGKRIVLGGAPATIVGVAPRAFAGIQVGTTQDVWVPLAASGGRPGVGIIARLKPGVSIEQARAEMRVLNRWRVEEVAKASGDPLWRQATLEVEPAGAGVATARDLVGRPLLVLMGIVALVLLLACGNVAGMLLARAAGRGREMAVRLSLGAGRSRLVRQVLTEALLLSAAAAVLGILLASVGADALARVIASGRPLPGLGQLVIRPELDVRVLVFTAAVAVLTTLLFGLAPAWSAFAAAPMSALRDAAPAGDTKSRRLFLRALVVAQVALSVVVLSAAGLFVRHLSNLRHGAVGFEHDSVLLVSLDPARSGYERAQLAELYATLLARVKAIPGVRSATLSAVTPIHGAGASRFIRIDGVHEPPESRRRVSLNWVTPQYFATFGTPLLAGRDFERQDAGRPHVAIVNRAMARHYFGASTALGRRFTFDGRDRSYEIVGIAGDAKYADLHEPAPPTIYLNALQETGIAHQLALRTSVRPTSIAADVRDAVRDVLKTVAVRKTTTLSDQVDASIVPERVIATLSQLFGALAAALAAIGLYGLLAYTVTRRVNEIGIRMALGATERDVTRTILSGAVGLVLAGLVAGAPMALWTGRLAAGLVANLPQESARPLALAAIVMIAATVLAAYVPARRAARVNPADALRSN